MLQLSEFFALTSADAKAIVSEVGLVVAGWHQAAEERGARPAEIKRMASAFEHADLEHALRL